MAATFKVRDASGKIVIDENMLLTRYLSIASIAWNDTSVKTLTHAGFAQGTPFYHVVNPNRHDLVIQSPVYGTASYVDCSFSGTTATYQQIRAVSEADSSGNHDLIVHFGVFG